MEIEWIRCETYEDARDHRGVVYLHEWYGKPFYWGKAHRSFFGGNRRKSGEVVANGRYSSGYRHWIEGCLKHGAKLYIGRLCPVALVSIDEVEATLIHRYGHVANRKLRKPREDLTIKHSGEVPVSVSRGGT